MLIIIGIWIVSGMLTVPIVKKENGMVKVSDVALCFVFGPLGLLVGLTLLLKDVKFWNKKIW